jgi:superfamily II DNA or RNA helicase
VSTLRPYQVEALERIGDAWARGVRRPGISLPTGVGKTRIMAALGRQEAAAPGAGHVLFPVHRDTLVDQTVAVLRATLDRGTSIGVVKAHRNEVGARVIVASVQSLRSAARRAMLPPIRCCVVDEAHVSVSPTYLELFRHIGAMDGTGARMAGFTATWSRSDELGLGDVWDEVVYHRSIRWAVREGYLVAPRGIRIGDGADASDVRISRSTGDYAEADLERVVMLESIRDAVVRGVLRHGAGRPGVLFAPTVASARYFADGLSQAGIAVAEYFGETRPADRAAADRGIRNGTVQILVTCTAIAVGYDNPQLEVGILCRPTQHEGMFTQMVGRLLRPWPGKREALLLDCVGSTTDVALRNAVDLSTTREQAGGGPYEERDEMLAGDDEMLAGDDEVEESGGRERRARMRHTDAEVDLYAGTQVQWLTSPVGLPFVPCGDTLVFVAQGADGWYVGQALGRPLEGGPAGHWVAQGLSQEDALVVASDHAESEGEHLSRRSAGWRLGWPSQRQVEVARRYGIDTEGMRRGQVSDAMSAMFSARVLAPFAQWSQQQRNAS